ncbi:ubiquitin conjugation factor E4 A [Palaemon carinicauda]|uniref:ubiquitin conjugation factor E4 A n=1 Tax=Palaemon carinicauda TaxID=392227 RepID=UPI0035B62D2E
MSENLQNNPFAALFSSVKEAEVFMKTTQPDKPEHQEITRDNNEAVTLLLEKLLLLTTREIPHKSVRVLLKDGGPLNEETFPLLLFDRLLLESPETCLIGSSHGDAASAEASRTQVIVYLNEIYRRCFAERDSPFSCVIEKVKHCVIENITTALEQSELYAGQVPNQQLLEILHKGLGKEAAEEDLVRKLLDVLANQHLTVPDAFMQLIKDLTKEMSQCSLMPYNYQVVDVFDFYASVPLLAPLLTKLPQEFSQDRTGRGYHHTPLGSLLAISCLPKNFGQSNEFFEKPSSKLNQAHKDTENSIWQAQSKINGRIYKIFYALLKVSPESKHKLLTWIEKCLEDNSGRAGLWHVQTGRMLQDITFVSDGFMVNLGAVMLQLAQPFTQDIKSAKILKVDPTYCIAPRVGNDNGVPGAYTGDLGKQTSLVPSSDDSPVVHSNQFSFISSCFFLTHRALHLGIQVVQQKLYRLSQDLSRLQHQYQEVSAQGSPAAERMHSHMETWTAELLSYKAAIFEPNMAEALLQFLAVSAEWLVQIALIPPGQKSLPTSLQGVTLPLPDDDKAHYYLQCIPEFLVETLTETISAVRRFNASLLDASGATQVLPHFMSFIIVFMGSPNRMNNPHLRAHLAECLETLLPDRGSTGGLFTGYREQMLFNHPASGHIVEALIHVFVSIEMTGQSVAFEEKFNYRRPMYEVMKYLWESPRHKKSFKLLADQALANMESAKAPLFLRFINLLINDAIFLLDEGLSYMSQLRESQIERDNGTWASLPAQQRAEREQNFQQTSSLARFHNMLGSSTIQTLCMLTKEISQFFTHGTLVDRIAAMLNYFLSTLVGHKQRNLKVRDMEKYEFRPAEIVSDICTIYTHLYSDEVFCSAVSADGRSYTPQLFSQAHDVLVRIKRGVLAEEIEVVALKVEEAGQVRAEEDDLAASAPEEFLDPIMSHLMTDPVILPSSKLTCDRQTIARHLLSDQSDPFNRQPLTMEEVIPNTELKQKISAWLEEQRSKRREKLKASET